MSLGGSPRERSSHKHFAFVHMSGLHDSTYGRYCASPCCTDEETEAQEPKATASEVVELIRTQAAWLQAFSLNRRVGPALQEHDWSARCGSP